MPYPTSLTPIAQLATYYQTEFTLTILAEELNNFGSPELIMEIEALHMAAAIYRINKPVGKRWSEATPKIGTKYTAEIEHHIPSDRYFISIISKAANQVHASTTKPTDYVTSYTDLPFEGKLAVACHVWDLSVEFPSMLIKEFASPNIYRISVPTNLIPKIHEIHNKYIVIDVRKGTQKSKLKLVNIGSKVLPSDLLSFEAYKPNTILQPAHFTLIENIVNDMPNESIIEIGSKWDHKEHPYQVTIEAKSPSPYGEVIWISDNITPKADQPTCLTTIDFLKQYTLYKAIESVKFIWDTAFIPKDGVLCRHLITNEIALLSKHNILLDQFIPLTVAEALNLVYDNTDEIPF